MNEMALHILEAFDRLGLSRLRPADLLDAGSDSEETRAALAELVFAGALREIAGQY